MTLEKILETAYRNNCSDVHLTVGQKPAMRKYGKIYIDDSFPIIKKEDMFDVFSFCDKFE